MITTLMMLLGLSGAGAGLYNVIKNPASEGPEEETSARSRRRNQRKSESPKSPSSPEPSRGKSPLGGRGAEVPFQTSPDKAKKQGLGEAKALSPDSPSLQDWLEDGAKEEEESPSARRRRNRKEEKSKPSLEELPLGEYGEEPKTQTKQSPPKDSPDISFPVDDIISKNSKYSFHRRPLMNAEALAERNFIDDAIEIYQRTGDRIPDEDIKNKIQQNISDLEDFLDSQPSPPPKKKGKDKTPVQREEAPKSESGLSDFVGAMREVAEVFADSIAKAIQFAQSSSPGQTQQSAANPPISLPNSGAAGSATSPEFLHPVIYQFLKEAPPISDYPGGDPSQEKKNYESLLKSLNRGLMSPEGATLPSGVPGAMPGVVGPLFLPGSQAVPNQNLGLPDLENKEAEEKKRREELAKQLEQAKQDLPNKEISDLELPEDTFFSDEWKEFRGLPLVDRRIGGERRKNPDRRENKAGRKDRRSGEDRRKVDLFKKREEYLKEKALEKLNEKAKALEDFPSPSLNDMLSPFFPPTPPKLNLPESAVEEEPKKEDEWIEKEDDWFDKTTEALRKELDLPDPVQAEIPPDPNAPLIGLPDAIDPKKAKAETVIETDEPIQVELTGSGARPQEEALKIGLPEPEELYRERGVKKTEEAEEEFDPDAEPPEIELVDGELGEISEPKESSDEMSKKLEEEPEKVIHGVLELKPPEADDAPFLTLTYDFSKIPHAFRLSKNYSIMEYSYYKYKPMLMKAQEFARRKMLKNALNYYRVIKSQNIPPELRKMINRNIRDITEFMEKFLMAKGG
ncbi:hypothetical protein LPTSP4_10750 [Leptospira ryugenii]|uniref:Uncharacterized protein n=1 Tax=Leptospira ryugenii TaxID=1917863 RepID=A0A2P2DY48_9LEPT|nr:hypothetical protein [Leptospira ryugenii]GBF49561.1 hypothetical protein LPTSP4_10750 [Leptospira ryugenii]